MAGKRPPNNPMPTAHKIASNSSAGVTAKAMARPELLAQVVHNKSLMFADKSASYETAVLGALRLGPGDEIRERLERDYAAMAEMFMTEPPSFGGLIEGLEMIEAGINSAV